MTWSADLSAAPDGVQLLLAFNVGAVQTIAIAIRKQGAWRSAWDDTLIPWTPYCWADPTPPDPAILGDDY